MLNTQNVIPVVSEDAGGADGILINNSVIFDNSRLTRTPTSASNNSTWTFSCWVKRSGLGSDAYLFSAGDTGLYWSSTNALKFESATANLTSDALFRDPGAWYHIVLSVAISGVEIYVNGSSIDLTGTPHSGSTQVNTEIEHTIGAQASSNFFDGYMALAQLVDGVELDATSFGVFDDNGFWNPVEYEPNLNVNDDITGAYVSTNADDVNRTEYIFAGQSIGTADDNRTVVVCTQSTSTAKGIIQSMTIGGISASLAVRAAATNEDAGEIWYAKVPNNSEADIVTTYDVQQEDMAISVYRLIGVGDVFSTDTALDTVGEPSVRALDATVSIDAGGFGIGLGHCRGGTSTWSSFTEDLDIVNGMADDTISTASKAYSTIEPDVTETYTYTSGSGTTAYLALVIFTPAFDIAISQIVYDPDTQTLGGDMTGAGGLAASFNGAFETNAASSISPRASIATGYIGIDYGIGNEKIARGADVYSPTNSGFDANWNLNVTISIWGSNTADPIYASDVNWTELSTETSMTMSQDPTDTSIHRFSNSTAYRHLKVKGVTSDTGDAGNYFSTSEVQFYAVDSTGFGINGFTLDFSDIDNLGAFDSFPNFYLPIGLTAADQTSDTPTDNKCTWSSILHSSAPILNSGNLVIPNGGIADRAVGGTIGVYSGKWYWEYEPTGDAGSTPGTVAQVIGMITDDYVLTAGRGGLRGGRAYYTIGGQKQTDSTLSPYGDSWTVNDRIGVAVDLDNDAIYFAKNGVFQSSGVPTSGSDKTGAAFTDLTGGPWVPFIHSGGSRGGIGIFNEDDFEYTPPEGFKAISTSNLPDPDIAKPSDYFQVVTYAGNGTAIGSGGLAVSGVGFKPDFVWIKRRDASGAHLKFDVVRGVTKYIDQTSAVEIIDAESLTSFDTDGFTVGNTEAVNTSDGNYVAWCWKANDAAVSNPDGLTATSVSANEISGFSTVTYTGTGAATTIGHGLNAIPDVVWIKSTDTVLDPVIYHSALTDANTKVLRPSGTAIATTLAAWDITVPFSASIIPIDTASEVNQIGKEFVAWCWSAVEGYSEFGSYIGNGSADGTFVYTGFRPAFVMMKTATAAASDWIIKTGIIPEYNPITNRINGNVPEAEHPSDYTIDMTSNGFKIRDAQSAVNQNGAQYIYMAFAESPFQGVGSSQARAR